MTEIRVSPLAETRFVASGDTGRFIGVANAYNRVDAHRSRFAPGAFARSLEKHRTEGTAPAMLWAHDHAEPIGKWTAIEERGDGLHVEGKLTLGTDRGRQALALMRDGVLGLSVGFYADRSKMTHDRATGVTTHLEAELVEVTLTALPSNPGAVITDVRSLTPRDLEHRVRDALGLSARQAKRLVSGGFNALVRDERADDPDELAAIADQLRAITRQLKRGTK